MEFTLIATLLALTCNFVVGHEGRIQCRGQEACTKLLKCHFLWQAQQWRVWRISGKMGMGISNENSRKNPGDEKNKNI